MYKYLILQLKKSNTKRSPVADLLKGLAVIFMIQVHIMEQFAAPEIYESVIGKISLFLGGPPCAPVFMAVMGYYLASSEKPFLYFLKRGLLLFSGGILLNIARSANLLHFIIKGKSSVDPFFYIFGVDIFLLAGISIILIGILRIIFKRNCIFYPALAFIMAAVGNFLPEFGTDIKWTAVINAFFWGDFRWSYFPLFPWIAYILLGFALHLFSDKYKLLSKYTSDHSLVFCIPFLAAAAITISYGVETAHDLKGVNGYYHHGILYFLWVVMFGAGYVMAVHYAEENTGKAPLMIYLKWVGKNVTAFYVIQWIIIGNFAANIFRSEGKLALVLWFLGITAAVSIITLCREKAIIYLRKKVIKKKETT